VVIVMTLLVRDEADTVAAVIEHHLAAGVAMVIATDHASVDGTSDILDEYRRRGVLDLTRQDGAAYDQDLWVTGMARRAALEFGADWVIHADADEFYWPVDPASDDELTLTGALESVDPAVGVIASQRCNLVADPDRSGSWVDRLVLLDTLSPTPRGSHVDPKVSHRSDPEVAVHMGNHAVDSVTLGAVAAGSPLEILHVPERSADQYRRKIRNGGAAILANPRLDAETGYHWREDYAREQQGILSATYAARQPDRAAVEEGLVSGRYRRDFRLRDRLHSLRGDAVVPAALDAILRLSS
jgi:hypothetical protein